MAIDTVTSRRQFLKLTGIGTAGIAAAELGGLGFDLAFAGQRAARRKLEGTPHSVIAKGSASNRAGAETETRRRCCAMCATKRACAAA